MAVKIYYDQITKQDLWSDKVYYQQYCVIPLSFINLISYAGAEAQDPESTDGSKFYFGSQTMVNMWT